MLTKNFFNLFYSCITEKNISEGITSTSGIQYELYGNTSSTNKSRILNFFNLKTAAKTKSETGVVFGTGNEAPKITDYWLSGDLLTTIEIVANTTSREYDDGAFRYVNRVTVANKGESAVTIGEMATIVTITYASSSGTYIMGDRMVLNTPITLAPGEQGVIDYTLQMPFA